MTGAVKPSAREIDLVQEFRRDGFVVLRSLCEPHRVERLRLLAEQELAQARPPLELEAQTGYPGAPVSAEGPGGRTVRRLLQASERHAEFLAWALDPALTGPLRALLGADIRLVRAHHNCIMTKQPSFSSDTYWHRDIRYWSFEHPELVSAWLALGHEQAENGGLGLVPGSHRIELPPGHFDGRLFLLPDLPRSRELLETAVTPELVPGDVLLFHCRLLHAASRNRTDRTKLSLVFTYRSADNRPLAGSRSASLQDIEPPPG